MLKVYAKWLSRTTEEDIRAIKVVGSRDRRAILLPQIVELLHSMRGSA